MSQAEDFIYGFEGEPLEIMRWFHELLTGEFNLTAKIRYKIPFYYGKTWICYLNPGKDGSVEFAFVRGNELSNEQGLLQHNGRKQVAGITLQFFSDIPVKSIKEVIHEAVFLDEEVPYQLKRDSKHG